MIGGAEKLLAFLGSEAAFGPDQYIGGKTGDALRPQRLAQKGKRTHGGSVLVAEDENPAVGTPLEISVEPYRLSDRRQGEDAALFCGFDRIGLQPVEIETLGLRTPRQNRLQPSGSHFNSFLGHIIEPRMF